jgi:uncharacterized protein (DUF1501 family)
MNRRDFFKFASAAGLCVVSSKASAEGGMDDDNGPFFVQVQAAGGWDPTMLCDPKGSPVNTSFNNDIKTIGGIRYANVGPEWATFFETNAHRMVVLNGVDVQSNNHDAGRRNMASGRLGEGHPNLAAMVAGYQAPHLPISFLSFGGYEETGGLVAPTRQVDRARLAGIIYPGRVSPDDAKSPLYHSEKARSLIDLARRKRAEALAEKAGLPKIKQSMDTLLAARLGSDQLQRLEELLPTLNGQGDQARVELAVAAYRAGVGIAANFARGGFDTHSNHNAAHRNAMAALLNLVNMLWAKVDEAGLAHRTVMLITSDFGPHAEVWQQHRLQRQHGQGSLADLVDDRRLRPARLRGRPHPRPHRRVALGDQHRSQDLGARRRRRADPPRARPPQPPRPARHDRRRDRQALPLKARARPQALLDERQRSRRRRGEPRESHSPGLALFLGLFAPVSG